MNLSTDKQQACKTACRYVGHVLHNTDSAAWSSSSTDKVEVLIILPFPWVIESLGLFLEFIVAATD